MPANPLAPRALIGAICLYLALLEAFQTISRAESSTELANYVLNVIQGRVEVSSRDSDKWVQGRLNQILRTGEKIRTGANSRAEIYFQSGSTVKLAPGSEIILRESGPEKVRGSFHVLNRENEPGKEYKLPSSIAAVRGTDFLIRIQSGGLTEVFVFDGTITLGNELRSIQLTNGYKGIVEPGAAPRREAIEGRLTDIIDWSLYYPVVLVTQELNLSGESSRELAESLEAYEKGDLLDAVATYPWSRLPRNPNERAYRAALLMAVGETEKANAIISAEEHDMFAFRSLRRMIAAVKLEKETTATAPTSASEWLAESYYQQSRSRLADALEAANRAVTMRPESGFGWARLAEMQFSFGDTKGAARLLTKALELSPRSVHALALRGFVLAAENNIPAAIDTFERAISLDSAFGYAWLGKGLCLIHSGQEEAGQRDLLMAASLEPQRAVFRSYLGKAFSIVGRDIRSGKELELAQALDPNDPTAWLYSALLKNNQFRFNDAVADLRESQRRNKNRSVFRSQLLLDQDAAVRSANLASIYRDVGMSETALNEASHAVALDYGNYSAHLFLANAYAGLQDPRAITLRFETAASSEYLMANLLAPVGAGQLSQQVSQQEYSRLFDIDHFGLSSSTTYLSSGDWQQIGSHFGVFGNTAYAVDSFYNTTSQERPNSDASQRLFSAQFKQQITPQDSIFVQALQSRFESGDGRQLYSDQQASASLRLQETQEPNLFVGYHRIWSPGIHTLFLGGWLNDAFTLSQADFAPTTLILDRDHRVVGTVDESCRAFFSGEPCHPFDLTYRSVFEAYSAELQQIWQTEKHSLVIGGRYQSGANDTAAEIGEFQGFPPIYESPASRQNNSTSLNRIGIYGYNNWKFRDMIIVTAGVSYDRIDYPENIDLPPISGEQTRREQISPKLGFVWTVSKSAIIRAAASRSLGGLFYDASVRLEPTQVAGFTQAFRSLIPEAVEGSIAGAEFETVNAGVDLELPHNFYAGVEIEALRSTAKRAVGVFDYFEGEQRAAVASLDEQELKFTETSLSLNMTKLLGSDWSLGATYRVSSAELESQFDRIPGRENDRPSEAILQRLSCFALYQHPYGFFAKAQSLWMAQDNRRADDDLSDEDFWHFDVFIGYRFPRRHAELMIGALNVTDQDYALNPLSFHVDLRTSRTFFTRLRFNF